MSGVSRDATRTQLQKMLASATFANAERMRRFLEFIVEHTISCPDEPLKEMIIGLELYASGREFDPRLSSVVRVDANRLRIKIKEYYDSEGVGAPLIIDLPKGSYTPIFRESLQPGPSPAPTVARTDISIAVLPFSNLSPEPEDYFSDGLTDEIIHALSAVHGLRVVARTSAFALKHKYSDVREVGRALNVGFVLEGSIRRSGEALRVTVQLASTSDGYQLWSQRYDRKIDDVFAVQDEIALAIVNMLRLSTENHRRAQMAGSTGNFEAYEWYLRGRHHLNRQTGESFSRAIDCFDQALARSARHAPSFSGKAVACFYRGFFSMETPLDAIPKARDAAACALKINRNDDEALSVMACIKAYFEWDWAEAEVLFRKSLQVQPGRDLSPHLFATYALLPMARFEEALAMLEEAKRIDPLSLFVAASIGAVLLMARRTVEAEAEYRRTLELDPNFWRALVGMGRCYEAQERYHDAILCFERATEVSDRVPTAIGALGRAYALAGREKDALRLLAELENLAERRYVSPYGRALIYLGLGDDRVFDSLERSCAERAGWLIYLATDPRFDPVREDVRFRSILQKLGLPILAYPAAVSR
jgi:TolB-like protein/Tfp pilus assembly protein PilF